MNIEQKIAALLQLLKENGRLIGFVIFPTMHITRFIPTIGEVAFESQAQSRVRKGKSPEPLQTTYRGGSRGIVCRRLAARLICRRLMRGMGIFHPSGRKPECQKSKWIRRAAAPL